MNNLRSFVLRIATVVLLTSFINEANAQVQTARAGVSTCATSNGFYEYLPQGYSTNTSQTYPLIIFIHGTGEMGDGTSQLSKLLYTGLAASINVGELPTSLNVNGQNFSFIVISPQFTAWPSPQDIDNVINYAVSHYRVNTSRIYLTGLSMGGGVVWDYSGNNSTYASRIAAIVPICGASWPDYTRARTIANANIAVWALHNNGDPTVPVSYTQDYVSQINQAPAPNPAAKATILNSTSHDAWTATYNSTNKDETGKTIYQWMLQFSRSGYTGNLIPSVNAGSNQTITLPTNSATLNGSASDPDGSITSYQWSEVYGPSNASFSSTTSASTTVGGLVAGTYTFKLTVTDNSGAAVSSNVNVVVNSAPVTTYTSIPGKVEAENYSTMYGIQKETTSDAGGGQNIGWQDNGDWMDYLVNASASGTYSVSFRVASMFTGAQFQLRNNSGAILTTVTVPNTGSFQTWQTVTANVTLPAGQQTLRIYTNNANGGWNFNWMSFAQASTSNQAPTANAGTSQIILLPVSSATLSGSGSDADGTISSYQWSEVSGPNNATISSPSSAQTAVSGLVQGAYTFRLTVKDNAGATATSDVSVTVNASSSGGTGSTIHIEAENYSAMYGIQKETTSDAGGGQNIGWQDDNDWMDYSVNVSTAGTYTIAFRVASMFTGAQFQLRNSSGTVLTTVTVPNTGSFQTWQTVTATATFPAGQQTLRIYTSKANGGWNINWWEVQGASSSTPPPSSSIRIEAENYSSMYGIQTENTADAGGGKNVGWQDDNDWMDYSVNVTTAGTYTVNFRVASMFTGAQFQLRNSSGTVLTTVTVPNTGNFQTWQTVSASVTLPAGTQTLRIYTSKANGGWNFNWWEIMAAGSAGVTTQSVEGTTVLSDVSAQDLSIFPNPVKDRFSIKLDNQFTGKLTISVVSTSGQVVKQFTLNKSTTGATQWYLTVGNIPAGTYVVNATMQDWKSSSKVVKE